MSGKSNGKQQPQPTVFDQLSKMILALGASASKAEAMARLSACQRMVKAIEQAFALQSAKVGHLQGLIIQITKGELRHLSLNVDGDPVHYRFTDSAGEIVYVVDAAQALVLVTPETVEPIIVDIELKDGTTTRVVVKHAQSDEEAARILAGDDDEATDPRPAAPSVPVDEGEDPREHHDPLRVPVGEDG